MSCVEVNIVWRNILIVIEKDGGFVEILCVILCVCVWCGCLK